MSDLSLKATILTQVDIDSLASYISDRAVDGDRSYKSWIADIVADWNDTRSPKEIVTCIEEPPKFVEFYHYPPLSTSLDIPHLARLPINLIIDYIEQTEPKKGYISAIKTIIIITPNFRYTISRQIDLEGRTPQVARQAEFYDITKRNLDRAMTYNAKNPITIKIDNAPPSTPLIDAEH